MNGMDQYKNTALLVTALLCSVLTTAQTSGDAEQLQRSQQEMRVPENYSPALGPTQLQLNANYWSAQVEADEQNADNQMQLFMSIRQEVLLNNNGTLPPVEQKKLDEVADKLVEVAPNSFEDNFVKYQQSFPEKEAFGYLDQARDLDENRSELISPSLTQALVNDDRIGISNFSKKIFQRQMIAPGLLAYGTDVLKSLEPASIIVVAGEMDGFPMLALQNATSLRNDVTVVDHRLLLNSQYRAVAWSNCRGSGAPPSSAMDFVTKLPLHTERPTYYALSLPPEVLRSLSHSLYPVGVALKYSAQPIDNMPLLEQNWNSSTGKTKRSHLQANYLLPGAVLLDHYERSGERSKEKELDEELKRIAGSSGKSAQFKQAGF